MHLSELSGSVTFMHATSGSPTALAALTLDDIINDVETPLVETTFVVVDLETTGTNSRDNAITEIGAVKVRAGIVLGEFQTFVNPKIPIPAYIQVLTGITNADVMIAPSIDAALSSFMEFAGLSNATTDTVLVAHNAGFDVGFLKANCARLSIDWPNPTVLDTVALARRALKREEVRNHKLSTLASNFNSDITPTHRALDDARATVHVLHSLIARLGNLGVHSVEALTSYRGQATERRRRKRHLAADAPSQPGVYVFFDGNRKPLYVGKSKNLRKRIHSYFTLAETRGRMNHMIELAQSVSCIPCGTELEASIREIRMIAELKPRFNVRSRNPERTMWLTFTQDRVPKLTITRQAHPLPYERSAIGPFASRESAQTVMAAFNAHFPIRECSLLITKSLSILPCALFEMNRCVAPCRDGSDVDSHNSEVDFAKIAMRDPSAIVQSLSEKLAAASREQNYESAAHIRDQLTGLTNAIHDVTFINQLRDIPELIAASPTQTAGWDIHVIRHGRLSQSAHVPFGIDPLPTVNALTLTSATLLNDQTLVRETEMILNWLCDGRTRMVRITDGYSLHMPITARPYSADMARRWLTDASTSSTDSAEPVSID